MAWPPGEHIENVIAQAKELLTDVRILRHDVSQVRAIIDLEGEWKGYRIIVSEVHRAKGGVRYAYYVLDTHHRIIHAFDNSPDTLAIKQKYGANWKSYRYAEVPHQHDAEGNLTLPPMPMTFETFVEWLTNNL